MEKKDWKQKWKEKNGLMFGLCLVAVAAFSVLFATGQVKQAQKEKEQIANEQALAEEENDSSAQVEGILPDAPDQEGLAAAQSLEEMSEGMEVSASDDVTAQMEEQETETEAQTEETEAEEAVQAEAEALEAQTTDILPTVTFGETDTLTWPVVGSVVLDYSMDGSIYFPTLNQYKYNPALVIGSDVGAQVVAAAKGVVESIGIDEETGTTVTMDIGDGYELTYGQLKELTVSEGDVVEEGALIGYVSEPTKYYCVEGSNLYFEMTKDGTPVDPVLYLE